MTYSIIGSGAIGSALALHFAKAGVTVRVANTRGVSSLQPLADQLGSSIVPSEMADALKADVVILALPFTAIKDVLSQEKHWAGRVVVDATNAIDFSNFTPMDLGGKPSTLIVAEHAPGATVVKAFNHIGANIFKRDADDGRGYGKRTLFLSGDNKQANDIVAQLMTKMGFAPIDLGSLSTGGLLQQFGGPLTMHSLVSQELDMTNKSGPDIVEH
ncbi:NADPH-dependent F420 reductase [Rhizobium gallicum]|uniref:NADPH-dependent F420 reductase n=1 Tax=Rhizobium gallicum TaxID=56730 RepID=UPI001EF84A4B|nr:NADPH-dependent F420 reductase [Rhizobium gallicum]ULJ75802.1 NADPH-dependent F420 reductase [Rhizobium gallicum]